MAHHLMVDKNLAFSMLTFTYFNKPISKNFALGLILSLLYPAKLQAAVVVYGPGHEGPGTNPSPKLAVISPDFSHRFSVVEQGVWATIRELFATAKSHPDTPLSRVTAEDVARANRETLEKNGYRAYWVPDTWLQLLQIEAYFTNSALYAGKPLETSQKTDSEAAQLVIAELSRHGLGLRDLDRPLLDYAQLVNEIIDRIERRLESPSASSLPATCRDALAQLIPGRELFTRAVQIETESRNESLIWRFCHSTKTSDRDVSLENIHEPDSPMRNSRTLSYAYSLLSGFVGDGYRYTKLEYGTPCSACTYCYWYVHHQAKELMETGSEEQKKTYCESPFFTCLEDHVVYAIKLPKDAVPALQKRLKLPRPGTFELAGSALSDGSFHHQACYGHGEEFHPRLNVKGLDPSELEQLQEILSRATLIYVKQKVTSP